MQKFSDENTVKQIIYKLLTLHQYDTNLLHLAISQLKQTYVSISKHTIDQILEGASNIQVYITQQKQLENEISAKQQELNDEQQMIDIETIRLNSHIDKLEREHMRWQEKLAYQKQDKCALDDELIAVVHERERDTALMGERLQQQKSTALESRQRSDKRNLQFSELIQKLSGQITKENEKKQNIAGQIAVIKQQLQEIKQNYKEDEQQFKLKMNDYYKQLALQEEQNTKRIQELREENAKLIEQHLQVQKENDVLKYKAKIPQLQVIEHKTLEQQIQQQIKLKNQKPQILLTKHNEVTGSLEKKITELAQKVIDAHKTLGAKDQELKNIIPDKFVLQQKIQKLSEDVKQKKDQKSLYEVKAVIQMQKDRIASLQSQQQQMLQKQRPISSISQFQVQQRAYSPARNYSSIQFRQQGQGK